ncbi:MAG: hypothetical protein PHU56_03165, partial [Candidatus Pacebacteria bacterium]|nr:hypothetical protein [Candidatus Paceibacterota bacterium]
MRKILSILVLSVLMVGLVAPVLVQGIDELPSGCTITKQGAIFDGSGCVLNELCDAQTNQNCGMCCLLNIIYTVTDWIFYIMMVAVVIVFVIAGAMFMMAGG